jgi:hypothetical protein
MDAPRIDALDGAQHVVVAAEEYGGIGRFERQEARIGRASFLPMEAALRVERHPRQLARKAIEPVLSVGGQVEMLDVGRDDGGLAGGSLNDREDGLAERAHLGQFGEAPFGLEPVPGQDQDDSLCSR